MRAQEVRPGVWFLGGPVEPPRPEPAPCSVHRVAPGVSVVRGDALDVLRRLPACSVDSIVTDPPGGGSFMSGVISWDDPRRTCGTASRWEAFRRAENPADVDRPSAFGRASRTSPATGAEGDRDLFVPWLTEILREALRVLKPGGHALVWSFGRTSHWTGWAIEGAGFEVRDKIGHLYSQGFPKSLDVAKAIEKSKGVRSASTDEARRWLGWGTALKPAVEWWYLARKPMGGTVVESVLRHGTGALNVDACRVPFASLDDLASAAPGGTCTSKSSEAIAARPDVGRELARVMFESPSAMRRQAARARGKHPGRPGAEGFIDRTSFERYAQPRPGEDVGRWPTNFILSHSPECRPGSPCRPDCPVAALDAQAGKRKSGSRQAGEFRRLGGHTAYSEWSRGPMPAIEGDEGLVSRFFPVFYCPKPARSEKEAGLDDLEPVGPESLTGRAEGSPGLVMRHPDGSPKANPRAGPSGRVPRRNTHPTPKAVALMEWLVRLVTPTGGVVLDPFAGSGSTGVGAVRGGFRFLGIEREPRYVEIARRRISHALGSRASDSGGGSSSEMPKRSHGEMAESGVDYA